MKYEDMVLRMCIQYLNNKSKKKLIKLIMKFLKEDK